MTLRLLVFGVLSLATMIPLLLFWAWPHSRALQNEMDAVSDRNLQIAETLAGSLQRYQRDLRTVFALVATNLIEGREMTGGEAALGSLGLRQACVVEPASGRITAGLATADGRCPETVDAGRLALLRALAISAEPRLSGVLADAHDRPMLIVALSAGGRIAYGQLGTDGIVALAHGIVFGDHGHAAIVDRDGRLLAHPDAVWQLGRHSLSELPPIRAALDGRSGTGVFTSPLTGKQMVAGFAAVEGAGWGVMVPQPLAELHSHAQAIQASALGVVAIGAAAAGLVAWLLSGLLIRPVRAVARAARALAAGARAPEVEPIDRLAPRELKDLRTAFNAMAGKVEASRREQETARRLAEEAYLTRSRFLAHMSHEVRTPLNAVIGFSETMLQQTHGPIGSPKYEEYLHDIHESAHHLLSLINDLLDLSRVDVEDLPFEEAEVPVDQVMSLASALIRPRAREKAISVAVTAEPPGLKVLADQRLLRRVLLHLLSNAVSFTPDGGWIVLRSRVLDSGELEIRVEDNGVGMTAEDCERVLRAGAGTAAQPGDPWRATGSGRGLSIVTRLVERHQGRFALESEPGLGTTAIVTLPAARTLLSQPRPADGDGRLTAVGS